MIAQRGDERILVEVKGAMMQQPLDRYSRIAEEVANVPG